MAQQGKRMLETCLINRQKTKETIGICSINQNYIHENAMGRLNTGIALMMEAVSTSENVDQFLCNCKAQLPRRRPSSYSYSVQSVTRKLFTREKRSVLVYYEFLWKLFPL
jgi:hypothetical protein